jgi:hypothetical protein
MSLAGIRTQHQAARPYREIVEAFRVNADAGIEQMLELPRDVVASGVDDAVRPDTLWPLQARGAAVLLHTDAAFKLLDRDRSTAWVHLDYARRLADAVARDPESAWMAHQWFVVVTAALAGDAGAKALKDHWHAQPWYAATSAMASGLDSEAYGSTLGKPVSERPGDTTAYVIGAFAEAKVSYRHAVAAHLEIAAVHLGRIEMLQGHTDDARRLFREAAINSHWRTTTYLANLFLGSMDEHDGDWIAAERHYRAAVEAVGTAQSGRLALAAFLGRHGRGADASRVLIERAEIASDHAFDPWWSYLYPYTARPNPIGQDRYAVILAELHAAVSR